MRPFSSKHVVIVAGCLLGAAVITLLAVWSRLPYRSEQTPGNALSLDQDIEGFIKAYWRRPIPLQGSAPPSFTDKEASLTPEACGSCHTQQYADWKESLHSRAMGPGPWGQIMELSRNSPDEAVMCMTCHAPLSEQMPSVAAGTGGERKYIQNSAYNSKLQLQGITCAACHVREHRRFGPLKVEGPAGAKYPSGLANHGGVERTPYFEKAEFCRDCHQFDPENTVLVNGKPIQDTYREWQNSVWGRDEAACQECHMPNRRHLWRGIHDQQWVKDGVRIDAHVKKPLSTATSRWELSVQVTNAAVGHKFPTYLTPRVFVRAALLDNAGKMIPGTQQERVIGWDARFEDGQWKEYFDTRVPPGETFQADFNWAATRQAEKIRAWVEVHPDYFYHHHFYPAYLNDQSLSPAGKGLVEKALRESGRTSYTLFDTLVLLK